MAENSHLQQITARFSMKARKHVAFLFGSHNAREADCRVLNYPFNYIGTVLKLPGATWRLGCRSAPRCHFLVWSLKKIKEFKSKITHLPTCTHTSQIPKQWKEFQFPSLHLFPGQRLPAGHCRRQPLFQPLGDTTTLALGFQYNNANKIYFWGICSGAITGK